VILPIHILPQPDDETCGPTCLHAVYRFWGEDIGLDEAMPSHPEWTPTLRRMLGAGTLSSRIRSCVPPAPSRSALHTVYAEIADCLREGALFRAP